LFDWTKGLEFGNIGDMTRDELISVALATNTIEVDQEYGVVYVLRGPGGTRLPEPRRCGTNCNGYLVANLMANGVKKQIRLHRAVWISKNGIPPEGQVVCHKDNNKTNNKIENLYLATHEQNSTDAKLSGLYKHTNAKIDFEIATNIRMDYGTEKYTMRELGDKYKLSKSRIHQIVRMKGWTEDGLDSSGNPTKISDTQRYKMCGNAVTVNVVEYIASLL
jgi:site-specific DNA-cytosine methylase